MYNNITETELSSFFDAADAINAIFNTNSREFFFYTTGSTIPQ